MKDILIRDAAEGDARALAGVCIMAGHGVMELFYEGLVPGKSVIDCVMVRRILDRDSFATFRRWRVATDASGDFLGALNSLPHKVLMNAPDDPLLDEARLRPIAARFDPPEGLTPAEVGTLLDNSADMRDITATLVDLAVRG